MDCKPPRRNSGDSQCTYDYQQVSELLNFAAASTDKAGFLVTVIFLYYRPFFPDVEFLSSDVADRPAPATDAAALNESNGKH